MAAAAALLFCGGGGVGGGGGGGGQRAYFTGMLGNDIPVTFDQLRAEITTTRNELHKYQQVLMTRLFDKPREEALAYYNQYYIHITRPDTLMDTL